ncbi:hypothetical protein VH22019_00020 [Vibrio phage VH2_2019]|nr:hypothetical protein VH22019_00020 [Vibrio phage VH2_2019]
MLHRIELSDGGRCLGAHTLEETRHIMDEKLYSRAGTVAAPIKVRSGVDGSKFWELWTLQGHRAMILYGYTSNPNPELLVG